MYCWANKGPSRKGLIVEEIIDEICCNIKPNNFICTKNTSNTRNIGFISVSDPNNPIYLDIFFGWLDYDDSNLLNLPMQKVEYNVVPYDYFGDGELRMIFGHEIRFPSQPIKFLEARYGENWNTPDYLFRIREN